MAALEKPRIRVRVGDGFANVVAQLGTSRDKAAQGSWTYVPTSLTDIDGLYRCSWLGRKIIDIPVGDMVREWRTFRTDSDTVEAIEAEEKRLQLRRKVATAIRWARLYGGAAIVIGDGAQDPSLPLAENARIRFLHVLARHQISPGAVNLDPMSEAFGLPETWTLAGATTIAEVHRSRIIPVMGAERPPTLGFIDPWGDSVFDAMRDALMNSATASSAIASLLTEAKVDVIKVDDLQNALADPEGEERLMRRFNLAALLKGINGMLVLDGGEDYQQKTLAFGGLPEVHARLLQEVSGAADIPLTRLLGQSPGGLQSTGESDLRNYYDGISAKQEDELRPILDRIDALMIPQVTGKPASAFWYEFGELWQLSEKDQAAIFQQTASAIKTIADAALVPDEALSRSAVALLDGEGMLPGLADAVADATEGAEDGAEAPDEAMGGDEGEGEGDGAAIADAAPRPLYVSRKVLNAAEIIAWAMSQGFTSTLAPEDLHVTVAFSRQPVDWMKAGEDYADDKGRITIRPGGPRVVEPLGDKGAVVLMFSSTWLQWRWRQLREIGCSWDHGDEYQPHITLTYQPGDVDPTRIEPYRGEIVLGPEVFEALDDDWAAKVVETGGHGAGRSPFR